MPSKSKEERLLKLILENSPLRRWHFDEITKEAGVTKAIANKWIKKFISQNIIKRVKEKGRFPYYTAGKKNPHYISRKKLYSLEKLHDSGLIPELIKKDNTKTIILFGSMIKGDWYKDSDIDIFVFGNLSEFDKKVYESRLKRNIQIHHFKNKEELDNIRSGLVKNVRNGMVIRGDINDLPLKKEIEKKIE